jgi:pimeloyl-ACP methyl ester carboxylesterase
MAFLYGRLTRGVNLADASPERSVVGTRVPILLIHGLADHNIPFQQSERIRAQNPAVVVLWEVPNAGHCGAVNAAGQEFNMRVLGWFSSHDRAYPLVNGTGSKGFSSVAPQVVEQ